MEKTSYTTTYTQPGFSSLQQQTTTTVTTQRYAKREWSFGLFDCCSDIKGLFCAYFCTCCYAYSVFKDAGEGFCDCLWGGAVPLRTKIRTERAIQGSICTDAFAVGCCPVCALVQMSNEIKNNAPLI